MHHTFRIPEILDLIFSELQDLCPELSVHYHCHIERRKILGCRDLAALARTCKTFRDPALDFLWREQDTLVNVFRCLPSHLWKEETVQRYPKRVFNIIGPISPNDWQIPLAYAFRVRKIKICDMNSDFLSDLDVFEMIEGSELPCDYLCPNLKRLVFNIDDEASMHLPLFLSSKVVYVDIRLPYRWPTPSLSNLPLRFPDLRTFHLDHYSMLDDYRSILSKVILTLHNVEDLALPILDRTALEHISRLPALRSLKIEALHLEDLGRYPRMSSLVDAQAPFSALREIYLVHTTMDLVIELLELLSSCRLASFDVGTEEPVTKSTTRQLYAALETHLSHSTLQTLRVGLPENEVDEPSGDGFARYTIDGSIVAPLLRFANLREVYLSPTVGFDLDDTMAWEIARAWPKIRTLSLTASTDLHYPSSMSLLGLTAFATYCPELASLTLAFDASTVPPLDDSPKIIVLPSSLTFLGVEMSPINDPRAVARFLSPWFPKLAKIETCDYWL